MDNNTSQLVASLRYHARKASTEEVVRELLQDAAKTIERLLQQAQPGQMSEDISPDKS